jgi:hypothetical protein
MSIAEHVTVFISIIVGLAVGDLLMSFHKLLRARERVKWHWLPLAVALFALLLTVSYWWLSFDAAKAVANPTVADFLPTLARFVVLFLLVAASLPDDVPAEGLDLRAWYLDNARLYWTLATISLLLDIFVDGARVIEPGGGIADLLRAKFNDLVILPFLVAMIFVRRLWYHGAFALVGLINMAWLTISLALGS